MYLFYLLLIVILDVVNGCHPECTWACDSPVCLAVCHPVCQPPICEVCLNTTSQSCVSVSQCNILCPIDMCESDACPQCETVCPDLCRGTPNCTVLCQAPECSWQCSKPLNCPYPQCLLQCEQPACEYSGAITSFDTIMRGISLFIVMYTLL
jgi:hypothetical protein